MGKYNFPDKGKVAEWSKAADLRSAGRNPAWVRIPPLSKKKFLLNQINSIWFNWKLEIGNWKLEIKLEYSKLFR